MTRLLLALLLLVALPVLAADTYVGTLESSGTSVSNTTTAAPFGLMAPRQYAVQCDAAAYVQAGPTATADEGVLLQAGQLYDVFLPSPVVTISIIAAEDGTASCKVFLFQAR